MNACDLSLLTDLHASELAEDLHIKKDGLEKLKRILSPNTLNIAKLQEENNRLRDDNVILRDACEELAKEVAAFKGQKPHALKKGMPVWIQFLPERVRNVWKKGGGVGRGFAR